MTSTPPIPTMVAAIIEQPDGTVLIVRAAPRGADAACWELPAGPLRAGESPEAGLRRILREKTGLSVDIDVGQPPVAGTYEGTPVMWRYFLGGVASGEAQPRAYEVVRWVTRAELRTCTFEPSVQTVVDWFLEE